MNICTRCTKHKNKAFRAYCTAIQCKVLQRDHKPQNFLLSKHGKITLIDFGVARKLLESEITKLTPLLAEEESGNAGLLRRELLIWKGGCLNLICVRNTSISYNIGTCYTFTS